MYTRHEIFILFSPNEQRGGGGALPDFISLIFPVQQVFISKFDDFCRQQTYNQHEPARVIPRNTGARVLLGGLTPAAAAVSRTPLALLGRYYLRRHTLAGLLLPSCLIVVSLLGGVWNGGTAPLDIYREGIPSAVFKTQYGI